MSFAEELLYNRVVYRQLSGGDVSAQRRTSGAEGWEEGEVPPDVFRRMVEQEKALREGSSRKRPEHSFQTQAPLTPDKTAGELPGQRSWEQAAFGTDGGAEISTPAERVYSIAPPGSDATGAAATAYPQEGGAARTQAGEDLLDTLLRRIEAGNRLYPQDLAEEGTTGW